MTTDVDDPERAQERLTIVNVALRRMQRAGRLNDVSVDYFDGRIGINLHGHDEAVADAVITDLGIPPLGDFEVAEHRMPGGSIVRWRSTGTDEDPIRLTLFVVEDD